MGNSASNISSIFAPAAKENDPYVTQSYVDSNFLTNGNFTTYDNYMKGLLSKIPTDVSNAVTNTTLTTTLANYPTNTSLNTTLANYPTNTSLNTTLRNSALYCPEDQAYCSLSNSKAGTNSIVASNNNIGIGTINPLEELHINRTTATNALTKYTNTNAPSGLDVGVDSNGNGIIFHRDTNRPITINTNNAERLRVSEGGGVGIGTTNTSALLTVNATSSEPGNGTIGLNGIRLVDSSGTRLQAGINTGYSYLQSHNNSRLSLNPAGNNVGIGTTNPSQMLDVNGNINASGNITSSGFITSNGNINSSGNITSNGNIGIGVTVPTQRLSIGPLTSSTDVIAMSLPNNWYIKMKGATITNPAGQLCFSNGNTAATSVDYVCIDPTKTS